MNREVIEKSIKELEQAEATYASCERLASLYIVRDHMQQTTTKKMTGSDFIEAAAAAGFEKTVEVINEHMEVIKLLHPKEYEAILQKMIDNN